MLCMEFCFSKGNSQHCCNHQLQTVHLILSLKHGSRCFSYSLDNHGVTISVSIEFLLSLRKSKSILVHRCGSKGQRQLFHQFIFHLVCPNCHDTHHQRSDRTDSDCIAKDCWKARCVTIRDQQEYFGRRLNSFSIPSFAFNSVSPRTLAISFINQSMNFSIDSYVA
jgi:hypothetical protein